MELNLKNYRQALTLVTVTGRPAVLAIGDFRVEIERRTKILAEDEALHTPVTIIDGNEVSYDEACAILK